MAPEYTFDGKDYVIVTPIRDEKATDIAEAICKSLDSGYAPREDDRQYLLDGNSIRPAGVFSVRIKKDRRTGDYQIHAQNLNGRGIEEYQSQLRKAIEEL